MKKNFKFMLVALLAVFGFNGAMAASLVGTTQYANNGLQYKIISVYKTPGGAKVNKVSVSQSDWNTKAENPTTLTIPATVTFSLKGEDTDATSIDQEVTFNVVEIEADGFKGLNKITSVSLPSSITTIGAGAFVGTKIKILDLSTTSITTLNALFVDATSGENVDLNKVILPATLTTLVGNTVYNPGTKKYATYGALQDCIQLSEVDFSKCAELATLGAGSLSNTIVDTYDFSKCYTLNAAGNAYAAGKFLNFTATVNPFVNDITTTNKNLEKVILPKADAIAYSPVTVISTAFANCEVLTEITNLEVSKITTVDDGAFAGDISLTELSFPASLTNVNGSPFKAGANTKICEKLAKLTFDGTSNVTIGNGSDLFGLTAGTVCPLEELYITVPATAPLTQTTATIAASALTNTGADSKLKKVEIAKAGIFAGTINNFALAEGEDAEVTFGNIAAGAIFTGQITGPTGTKTTTLTIGDYANAATQALIKNVISKATVGAVTDGSVLEFIGQAVEIDFKGAITFVDAPTTANAVLTTVNFNDVTIPAWATGTAGIEKGAFDGANAPLLTDVTWKPTDTNAKAAFAIDAFGAASVGAAAKVTLHTTTAVASLAAYNFLEANLYNVIFDAVAPTPTKNTVIVTGNASAAYYYGKASFAVNTKIAKETEAGEQVTVYSAFVDASDNKIYMDPLAIVDGYYVVAANEPVVIRMKSPKAPVDMADTDPGYVDGGKKVEVEVIADAVATPTMRYDNTTAIVNDLQISDKLFSSDYIGTTYVGKTLYAMKNPAKVGALDWGKVNKKSYLPADALFVECDESVAAARLEMVWLDGTENVTAIQNIIDKKGAQNGTGVIYNLAGQKVDANYKGIIIKNGKKYFNK